MPEYPQDILDGGTSFLTAARMVHLPHSEGWKTCGVAEVTSRVRSVLDSFYQEWGGRRLNRTSRAMAGRRRLLPGQQYVHGLDEHIDRVAFLNAQVGQ